MSLRDAIDYIKEVRSKHENLVEALGEALGSTRTIPAMRADDWIAVSAAPKICTRLHVIASRLNLELTDEWDAQARWRADRGSAIHHVFQELWLGPLGWLLGGWKCPRCAHIHGANDKGDVWPSTAIVCPQKCEKCDKKWKRQDPFHFVEPHSVDTHLKVRGRLDGLLRMPGYYPEVIDLKTTHFLGSEHKPWSVIRAPREADVKQLQWYMDSTQCRRGRILYLDPSAERIDEAIVEHRVSFNPTMMHKEKEKIRGLREALQETTRPVPDCPNGRKFPYGNCPCVEVESLWAGAGY